MNVDVTIYEVSVCRARICIYSAFLKARVRQSIPHAKRARGNAQTLYVSVPDLLVLKKRSRKRHGFLLLLR